MRSLQASFRSVEADVARRREALEKALLSVSGGLATGVGRTILKADLPLARAVADVNVEAQSLVEAWVERVGKSARALNLRSSANDALLVYVLGKVKAGKSSLGNAVAYGRYVPPMPEHADPVPWFFTEAVARRGEPISGQAPFFAVGAGETTSTIQGFQLAGLTWIDAPGLKSVTPENGALASEYAESADLVIYTMHSGSPGRSDDADEIRKLVRACQRFLVVITCCDRWEEDETPDGQVVGVCTMKADCDRAAQVRWVQQQLVAAGAPAETEILTLSVRYADAHAADPASFAQSGMAAFYELLRRVAQSEAISLKSQTPSRNLDALLEEIVGTRNGTDTGELSLRRLDRKLRALLAGSLDHAKRDLAQRQRKLLAAAQSELPPIVGRLIAAHAPAQRNVEFQTECEAALHALVSQAIREEVFALLGGADGAIFPSPRPRVSAFPPFTEITREATRSNRGERGAAGAMAGALAGGIAGAELGTLIGFIFPGPGNALGAALGGMVGAAAAGMGGRWAGRELGSEWKEVVKTGRDNRAEVEARALEALAAAAATMIGDAFLNLDAAIVRPVQLRTERLLAALDDFRTTLVKGVHS